MPTLQELFKTKKIDGNLTAEKKYDIRNSKDIRVIDGFAINALRRSGIANRLRETRIEEELIGVRAIRGLRSPLLYGTDILRFKEKSTPILNDMKLDASGTQTQDGGLVGKGLAELTGGKINSLQQLKAKAQQTAKKVTDKLGINFPETKIPTRIKNDSDFQKASPHELVDTLKKIKLKSEGNFAGRVLSSALKSSTPNQIGNKIVGEALRIGKQQLKKAVLGTNEINFGSITAQPNIGIGSVSGIKTVYTNKDETSPIAKIFKGELPKYSKSVKLDADKISDRNDLTSVYSARYKEIAALNSANMLPDKEKQSFITDTANSVRVGNSGISLQTYSTKKDNPQKNIEVLRGMKKGSDYLNSLGTYSLTEKELIDGKTDATGKFIDDYDFVPLRIYSIAKETAVSFRATLSGISETMSPSWESNKTLGNPFSYYTYSGIERQITFAFKVFSLNAKEHKSCWEKLNFLTGLVYPGNGIGVSGHIFITPPFLKLTLGDMFKNAEGFIDSLSYDIDDNIPWEIGLEDGDDLKNYKLPRIVNVNITFKFLDTMGDSYQIEDGKVKANRFYSFGGVPKNQKLKQSDSNKGKNETNPDGSATNENKGQIESDIKKDTDIIKNQNQFTKSDKDIDDQFTRENKTDPAVQKAFNFVAGKRLR